MVDLKRDRIDKTKADDGIWVDIPDFAKVRIRRWNNDAYKKLAMKLRDMKMEELKIPPDDDLPEEFARKIMVEAACHTVIVDWEGVESDGKPTPYTAEVGVSVFNDPDDSWVDEFNYIVTQANKRNNYALEKANANTKK